MAAGSKVSERNYLAHYLLGLGRESHMQPLQCYRSEIGRCGMTSGRVKIKIHPIHQDCFGRGG